MCVCGGVCGGSGGGGGAINGKVMINDRLLLHAADDDLLPLT